MSLCIMGHISAGKSTLVNALIQCLNFKMEQPRRFLIVVTTEKEVAETAAREIGIDFGAGLEETLKEVHIQAEWIRAEWIHRQKELMENVRDLYRKMDQKHDAMFDSGVNEKIEAYRVGLRQMTMKIQKCIDAIKNEIQSQSEMLRVNAPKCVENPFQRRKSAYGRKEIIILKGYFEHFVIAQKNWEAPNQTGYSRRSTEPNQAPQCTGSQLRPTSKNRCLPRQLEQLNRIRDRIKDLCRLKMILAQNERRQYAYTCKSNE